MILLLVLTLVASMFLAACAPKKDLTDGHDDKQATTNEPSGTLIVGFDDTSGNFNPAYYFPI